MSRISHCFENLAQHKQKALIPYITVGDPDGDTTLTLMHAMVKAGVNIIELGVPFSDPMADGPVIQQACERSLAAGMTLRGVLDIVSRFRQDDDVTPVVLMGYLNPVEAMGYSVFMKSAADAGVDGLLLVDLPPEEGRDVIKLAQASGLDMVFLIAPTTTEESMSLIADSATGYLYYVSLRGVTGWASLDVPDVARRLETIRKHTHLPIGVGFGIKDAASAAAVSAVADGVVVGSVLMKLIAEAGGETDKAVAGVSAMLQDMRSAMDQSIR